MKLIQTIFFGVFLTGSLKVQVHAGSGYSIEDFFTTNHKEFCTGLQTWMDASSDSLLPFAFSHSVIKDLDHVSPEFLEFLYKTETELKKSQPLSAQMAALTKTIDVIFESVANRTKKKGNVEILHQIKQVDPLGFDAFLTKFHRATNGEFEMDDVILQFFRPMADRLLLLHCKDDPSLVKNPAYNAGDKLNSIPEAIRKEIATEDASISETTINHFLDIVDRQFPTAIIYHVKDNKVHHSNGTDGLRILFGGRIGRNNVPNWICIRYNAFTKQLHVYDNVITIGPSTDSVSDIQETIIHKQFPNKALPIIHEKSKTPPADPSATGIYAMIYACTSLLGEDPSKIKFKLNYVYGDKSLYMRLHLLKIFANQRLAAMV